MNFDKTWTVPEDFSMSDALIERVIANTITHSMPNGTDTMSYSELYEHLLKNIVWKPRVDDQGEGRTGSIAKRISAAMNDVGYRLSMSGKSLVGRIVDSEKSLSGHTFSTQKAINWRRGEFYDFDSCFFLASRGLARKALADAGWGAILLRDTEGVGQGRAWFKPRYPRIKGVRGTIFNVYCQSHDRFLASLRAATGLQTTRHPMQSARGGQGDADGLIWINNDVGYVLHTEDASLGELPAFLAAGKDVYRYCEWSTAYDCERWGVAGLHWKESQICQKCYERKLATVKS